MDFKHRNILQKLRHQIVKDLDIENVLDLLISENVVTVPFYKELKSEPVSETQNRKLLDFLPRRGPKAYSTFKEALQRNYHWMSDAMDALENTEDCVDALDAPSGTYTPHSYFPANPPLSVQRAQKTTQLRNGLENLKPGQYLALHALQGYGKSSLASATLRDKDLIARLFRNEIYWMKFGQPQSLSQNILIQLNLLFHQVRNLDLLAEPTSKDSLQYFLKRHFSEHDYALIILDDVNSREVIEAFDFGCKTLVLTTDTDILSGRDVKVIKISDGFSSKESLDLFAKATGIPVSNLPRQAQQIHEECKGMPLMIAMFSAQFEDIKESLTMEETWSYYLDALRKKKSNVFQEPLERRAATFDVCIDKLSPEDKRFYETLAIFPEDVNISTKTLSIFWDADGAEVDARMLRFCKKALACREWHRCFGSYIYGVHNLVLSHLREKLDAEDLKKLHKSYVEKNLKICNGDFSKLPQDNYVHSYVGYHMEKGGLTREFSKVYLNFGFIETKIFHIGPGDLLIDLKKYRKHITQDSPQLLISVEDLEAFLIQQASTLAEYRRRNCLDLVQVALKHSSQGFVRNTAESLARQRETSLYLNHTKHNAGYLNSSSEELHLQVRSVAFTNEADVILVGNDEGKIISWNCNDKNHATYFGNDSKFPITKIVAPRNGKFFVSISADGTARLFEYQGNFNSRTKTLHPRAKQPDWQNMSESKSNQEDSRFTFFIPNQKITDVAVSGDGDKIAVCTDAGFVAVWDSDGKVLVDPKPVVQQNSLKSIAFTTYNTILHTVNGVSGALVALDASNCRYKTQFRIQAENDKIISLLPVPSYCNSLVLLLETKLYRATWVLDDTFSRPQALEFAKLTGETIVYTCAAITRDGRYVVTADTGGSVNVFDLTMKCERVKTYKNFVSSLDTHWMEDEEYHIICGGNRDTLVPMVHRWKFYPQEKPVVQRLPLFDAKMELGERSVIAVATTNKTVQIIQNDEVIAETQACGSKISSLIISADGNKVVYATEEGYVSLFDIKLNHSVVIMELSGRVDFTTILKIEERDVIVCEDGGDNLMVWRSLDDTQLVENSGAVIYCDIITSVQRVITVADMVVKLWHPIKWFLQSKHVPKNVPKISSCALSPRQNYLALGNANGNLNLTELNARPDCQAIKFKELSEKKFDDGITACDFSSDEEFLAVGFKTGGIIVLGVRSNSEIWKLELHRCPIKQLYWSPPDIEEHVLLSLTNELAWWKVSPSPEAGIKREISHSLSEPTISQERKGGAGISGMRASKSLEISAARVMENLDSARDSNSVTELAISLKEFNGAERSEAPSLRSSKIPKYSNIPGLLGVVKLDGDSATKVCVSENFDNFVTIDGEGAIYNLKVFETGNEDDLEEDA